MRGQPARHENKSECPANVDEGRGHFRLRQIVARCWSVVSTVGVVLGILAGWSVFRPRIEVTPVSPIRSFLPSESSMRPAFRGNAPSSTFSLKNASEYAIQDVKAYCWDAAAKYPGTKEYLSYIVKDAKGRLLSPDKIMSGESLLVPSLEPEGEETFQCTLPYLRKSNDPEGPDLVPNWADMRIMVKYKLLGFFPTDDNFRFTTESTTTGTAVWHQQP